MSRYQTHTDILPADKYARYPSLESFTHYEHGKDANLSFKDLLGDATSVGDITVSTGTEVHGVQLSSLTKEGKDQLALFVARRKVVGKFVSSSSRLLDRRLIPVSA